MFTTFEEITNNIDSFHDYLDECYERESNE